MAQTILITIVGCTVINAMASGAENSYHDKDVRECVEGGLVHGLVAGILGGVMLVIFGVKL